ncbi:MAG: hypothetical protein RR182_00390 [Alistipes sp.]
MEQMGGYDGCKILFEYLTELEDETGDELELDPIGFACDFTWYGSVKAYAEDQGAEWSEFFEVAPDELDGYACGDADGFFIQG